MDVKKITIDIPVSILDKLCDACECSTLKENHQELILAYLQHSANGGVSLPGVNGAVNPYENGFNVTSNPYENCDEYEELIGALDFDNI